MYRTPVIIRKVSPDRANRNPKPSGGVLLRPEGAYYTATCQSEKKTSHGVSFKKKNCHQHS